jgi:hypothetical protein
MSGRPVIAVLFLSMVVMGFYFYQTLQKSPGFKDLATEQMASEYSTYTQTFQKIDRLPVGSTESAQFYVPLKPDWKFEIHDKTLVAFPPAIESLPAGQPPTADLLDKAKQAITQSLRTWLEDKYHTKKDLLVDVRLESPAQR